MTRRFAPIGHVGPLGSDLRCRRPSVRPRGSARRRSRETGPLTGRQPRPRASRSPDGCGPFRPAARVGRSLRAPRWRGHRRAIGRGTMIVRRRFVRRRVGTSREGARSVSGSVAEEVERSGQRPSGEARTPRVGTGLVRAPAGGMGAAGREPIQADGKDGTWLLPRGRDHRPRAARRSGSLAVFGPSSALLGYGATSAAGGPVPGEERGQQQTRWCGAGTMGPAGGAGSWWPGAAIPGCRRRESVAGPAPRGGATHLPPPAAHHWYGSETQRWVPMPDAGPLKRGRGRALA